MATSACILLLTLFVFVGALANAGVKVYDGDESSTLVLEEDTVIDLLDSMNEVEADLGEVLGSLNFDSVGQAQLRVVEALSLVSSLKILNSKQDQQQSSSTGENTMRDLNSVEQTLVYFNMVLSNMLKLNNTQIEVTSGLASIKTLQLEIVNGVSAEHLQAPAVVSPAPASPA